MKKSIDSLNVIINTIKSDSLKVDALLNLSNHYGEVDFSATEDLIYQAISIINSIQGKSKYWYDKEAVAYDKLGVMQRKASNYEKALAFYLKALSIKETQKDSSNIGRSFHNLGMLFRFQKKYKKAKYYFEKAINIRLKLNDSSKIATSLNMYGIIFSKLKQQDSAIYYYEKAKKIYSNELQLSLKYLEEAEQIVAHHNSKKHLLRIYQQRYLIAKKANNYKKALEFKNIYSKYKDSIYDIEKEKRITTLELNYKHQKEKLADSLKFVNEKREINLITTTEQTKNKLYFILLMLSLASIFGLFLFIRNKKKLNEVRISKECLKRELLDEKLKQTTYRAECMITDNKIRKQFKKDLLSRIKTLKDNADSKSLREYQSLVAELQSQINTEKRLDAISESLIKIDEIFESKLYDLCPTLNKGELEICTLIRINLSLKEIMNIKGTSMASIKSYRYRIRKKLGIPKSVELELFIQNLF